MPAVDARFTMAVGPPRCETSQASFVFANRQHTPGTRRVRQPERVRSPAGTGDTRRRTDLQDKRAPLMTARVRGYRFRTSMVRRGSTVRVRQRTLVKYLQTTISGCLLVEHADTFRTHLRYSRRSATSRDAF